MRTALVFYQQLMRGPSGYLVDSLGLRILRHGIAISLSVLMGFLAWSLVPHSSKPQSLQLTPVAMPQLINAQDMAGEIASSHLFGMDSAETADAGPPPAAMATIVVEGIIYSEDQDMALAILNVNGKSEMLKVGDILSDGEKLLALAPEAVQIGNGGFKRVVELERHFGNPGPNGIQLAGVPGLTPTYTDPFPNSSRSNFVGTSYVPILRAPDLSAASDNPLAQMQSLRQQLIH
jgi:hypothetical protein